MPYHTVTSAGEPPHRIHYRLFGESDSESVEHRVLFTMGLGGLAVHWEPQRDFFAAQAGFQLCVYDNRGIGHSEPVEGPWTMRAMAKDALSLLDGLNWNSNIHLVGLSMGGMVTQELALLDLHRFSSITLLSTAAGGLHSLSRYARSLPTGVQRVARTVFSKNPEAQLKAGLSVLFPPSYLEKEVFNPSRGRHESNLHRHRRMMMTRGQAARDDGIPSPSRLSPLKQGLAVIGHRVPRSALRQMSRHFKDAALVITGDQDILVHQSNSQILSQGLNARLIVIENAGHGANEQHPERVNEAILDNIRRGKGNFAAH